MSKNEIKAAIDTLYAADKFVSGKSAHALLAIIATATLPDGLTAADVAAADVRRVERKAARTAAAA